MVIENLPPITTDMFSPKGRSRETDLSFDARVRHFFGPAGEEFARGLEEDRLDFRARELYRERINTHFFNALQDTYTLPSLSAAMLSYHQGRGVALGVVQDVTEKTGLTMARNPSKDEVSVDSPSPVDLLFHLARLKRLEGTRLGFDIRRHFALLNIAVAIESSSGNGRAAEELFEIQCILDKYLYYKGEEGYTEDYEAYTYHDVETNTFLRSADESSPKPPSIGEQVFHHKFNARRIEGVGLVDSLIRRKNLVSATEKVLSKAVKSKEKKGDGIIRPDCVEDLMGIRLIALGGGAVVSDQDSVGQVDKVFGRVLEVIGQNMEIKNTVKDDEVDKDRGQANIKFRRSKLYLEGMTAPLELIVIPEADYYNQEYEVGGKNPETGFYEGQAHSLYELRRIADCGSLLLPTCIYKVNPPLAISRRMEEEAARLKKAAIARIDVYSPQRIQEELACVAGK